MTPSSTLFPPRRGREHSEDYGLWFLQCFQHRSASAGGRQAQVCAGEHFTCFLDNGCCPNRLASWTMSPTPPTTCRLKGGSSSAKDSYPQGVPPAAQGIIPAGDHQTFQFIPTVVVWLSGLGGCSGPSGLWRLTLTPTVTGLTVTFTVTLAKCKTFFFFTF